MSQLFPVLRNFLPLLSNLFSVHLFQDFLHDVYIFVDGDASSISFVFRRARIRLVKNLSTFFGFLSKLSLIQRVTFA